MIDDPNNNLLENAGDFNDSYDNLTRDFQDIESLSSDLDDSSTYIDDSYKNHNVIGEEHLLQSHLSTLESDEFSTSSSPTIGDLEPFKSANDASELSLESYSELDLSPDETELTQKETQKLGKSSEEAILSSTSMIGDSPSTSETALLSGESASTLIESSEQPVLSSNPSYSLSSATNFGCDIYTTKQHTIFINGDQVGSYSGNSFYWKDGSNAGVWSCDKHRAYTSNGRDLGYAPTRTDAALLIYNS
jgi:hypothetical protein